MTANILPRKFNLSFVPLNSIAFRIPKFSFNRNIDKFLNNINNASVYRDLDNKTHSAHHIKYYLNK